jgi:hypothetical protein
MKDVTDKNFGVIIAFLLPGFILLWGLSFSSDVVSSWLTRSSAENSASVGGFLYATLASLALGLLISAVRSVVIDTAFRCVGIRDPGLDYGKLKDKDTANAFNEAIENNYRYYQYYANSLVAMVTAFGAYCFKEPGCANWKLWIVGIGITLVLFVTSKDMLTKFYQRAHNILSA